jgi:hypothetical protein
MSSHPRPPYALFPLISGPARPNFPTRPDQYVYRPGGPIELTGGWLADYASSAQSCIPHSIITTRYPSIIAIIYSATGKHVVEELFGLAFSFLLNFAELAKAHGEGGGGVK